MSAESYLVQLFLLYHLGICSSFLVLDALLSYWRKTPLQPVVAYRTYLSVFLLATLAPLAIVVWQASLIGVFEDTVSVNRLMTTPSPETTGQFDNGDIIVNGNANITGVELAESPATGFALVSNSENTLHVWDQLSYMLSPVLRLAILIFCIGIVLQWLRTLTSLYRTNTLISRSKPMALSASTLRDIKSPVRVSREIDVPMAVGLFKPAILIPQSFLERLNKTQLRHVLLHENAHHQRRDLWASLLTTVLANFYWWNPLLSAINYKVRLYREIICDETAAKDSKDELGYAQALLDCASLILKPRRTLLVQEFVGNDKQLKTRLLQLLDASDSGNKSVIAVILPLLLLITLGTSTSYLLAEQVQKESQQRIFRQYRLLDEAEGQSLLTTISAGDLIGLDRLLQNETLRETPIALEGTALMAAIRNGNAVVVDLILSRGANPDQGASRHGNPLILAAALGQLDIMGMLIAAGADVNAIVPRDETPLMSAARHGQLAAAELLIEHGADKQLGVRTAASDGLEYRTPLMLASTPEMRQMLTTP